MGEMRKGWKREKGRRDFPPFVLGRKKENFGAYFMQGTDYARAKWDTAQG
jgi:hypothetical protein